MPAPNRHPQGSTPSPPGPIPSLLAAILVIVLLATLFVIVLPVALILVGALAVMVIAVKAKSAFDSMGAERKSKRVPRHDREGRRNVRVINR
jgi:hypothetical protein